MQTTSSKPKALLFDVFGTVVDWRGSVIKECQRLCSKASSSIDWESFADAWRNEYAPSMDRVRTGELPWINIDGLHRMVLDELVIRFKLQDLSESEKKDLNLSWHRLDPWPDSREGLIRLKQKYIIATLSNGNVSLLVDLARYGGLSWDCVFSAELFQAYKPDDAVYYAAVERLGLQPEEAMMVASHREDIIKAKSLGLQTAFVYRPLEYGSEDKAEEAPEDSCDYIVKSLVELSEILS